MNPNEEKRELNPVVEIAGCGDRASAVVHLSNILAGYSKYVAMHLYNEKSKAALDEALNNLDTLAELVRYAESGKLPNE